MINQSLTISYGHVSDYFEGPRRPWTLIAHNHPSGLAEPSRADEVLTQALKQALALVDVKVLDHFVVGGSRAMSFAERGLL
jgi:DNA repair protein RadC